MAATAWLTRGDGARPKEDDHAPYAARSLSTQCGRYTHCCASQAGRLVFLRRRLDARIKHCPGAQLATTPTIIPRWRGGVLRDQEYREVYGPA